MAGCLTVCFTRKGRTEHMDLLRGTRQRTQDKSVWSCLLFCAVETKGLQNAMKSRLRRRACTDMYRLVGTLLLIVGITVRPCSQTFLDDFMAILYTFWGISWPHAVVELGVAVLIRVNAASDLPQNSPNHMQRRSALCPKSNHLDICRALLQLRLSSLYVLLWTAQSQWVSIAEGLWQSVRTAVAKTTWI